MLIKDLPQIKAGAIFIEDCQFDGYSFDDGEKNFVNFERDTVENNPEWFRDLNEIRKEKAWYHNAVSDS